jgi:hypothetical protein
MLAWNHINPGPQMPGTRGTRHFSHEKLRNGWGTQTGFPQKGRFPTGGQVCKWANGLLFLLSCNKAAT